MARSVIARLTLAATFLVAASGRLSAQHSHGHSDTAGTGSHAPHAAANPKSGTGGDWKSTAMARHMAYSSARPLTAADSARASHVINELRQAIAKYNDVKLAEADGYKMFAPHLKNQPQYHFTKGWNAIRNQWGFDPARPTSLLYKKNSQGEFVLIGAMYTASKRTSEDELNERVPLSVARCTVGEMVQPALRNKEAVRSTRWAPIRPAGRRDRKSATRRGLSSAAFGWMCTRPIRGQRFKSSGTDDQMTRSRMMASKNPTDQGPVEVGVLLVMSPQAPSQQYCPQPLDP